MPDEHIVSAKVFEGYLESDSESLNALTLEEQDRRTKLTILVQHKNQEHHDAHVNSGMEAGMQDALDLLEQAVVALAERDV